MLISESVIGDSSIDCTCVRQVNNCGFSHTKERINKGSKINLCSTLSELSLFTFTDSFSLFSNTKADAERTFKRYADVAEQAEAVGVNVNKLIVGTHAERLVLAANKGWIFTGPLAPLLFF